MEEFRQAPSAAFLVRDLRGVDACPRGCRDLSTRWTGDLPGTWTARHRGSSDLPGGVAGQASGQVRPARGRGRPGIGVAPTCPGAWTPRHRGRSDLPGAWTARPPGRSTYPGVWTTKRPVSRDTPSPRQGVATVDGARDARAEGHLLGHAPAAQLAEPRHGEQLPLLRGVDPAHQGDPALRGRGAHRRPRARARAHHHARRAARHGHEGARDRRCAGSRSCHEEVRADRRRRRHGMRSSGSDADGSRAPRGRRRRR